MADDDGAPTEPIADPTGGDRYIEPVESVTDGDISTSPEALAVLHEQGVDAWRQWVAEHQEAGPAGEEEA